MKNSTLKELSKSAIWPALLSALVVPGAGQIYNRDYFRGIFLLVISIGGFFWFSSILTEQLALFLPTSPETWMKDPDMMRAALSQVVGKNPDMFITFYALMILTWGFGVVDAYVTARKLRNLPPPTAHENTDTLN